MASQMPGYLNPQGGGGAAASTGVSGIILSGNLIDTSFVANESLSGGGIAMAVAVAPVSGVSAVWGAYASVSGRMPAIGVITSNYLSGATVLIFRDGLVQGTMFNFSGWTAKAVFVGRSGQIVASGAPSLSGDIQQIMGVSLYSGMEITVGDALQGVLAQSGDVGSGVITGQAGGGYFCVASGTLNQFDIGSGGVASGNYSSGSISQFKLTSGAVNSGHVGSGAVVGRAGGGAFTIGSGTIGGMDLASGAVNSGHVGSGAVTGMAVGFQIASGSMTGFELGSGAVISGRVASGVIGFGHLANAGVQSGSIASGNVNWAHWSSGNVWGSSGITITYTGSGIRIGQTLL